MSSPDEPMEVSRTRRAIALVGPWVVALLALAWVIRLVRWSELVRALGRVDVAPFVIVSVLMLGLMWLADAFAMQHTFEIFGLRTTLREMMIVRGATYLFAAVQYYAGQAAILGFLYRRGTALSRAAGWMLFISAINFGILLLLAAAGIGGSGLLGRATIATLSGVAIVCVAYLVLLLARPRKLVAWPVVGAVFEAGIAGHVRAVVVRVPHVAVLIAWNVYALRAFGVQVPIFAALALVPVVLFSNALPVSAQGLGLAQAASIFLFARYGGPTGRAAVLASSLSLTSIAMVAQLAIGVAMLPAGRRLGFGAAQAAT